MVNFLGPEDRTAYDSRQIWDEIRLRVLSALASPAASGRSSSLRFLDLRPASARTDRADPAGDICRHYGTYPGKKTSVGTYSYHRIDPGPFAGFDWYGKRQDFLVATPEKAVVDSFYLSSRRGKQFGSFPEIDLKARFSFKRAVEFAKLIRHDPWTRKYVLQQLEILRRQVTSTP